MSRVSSLLNDLLENRQQYYLGDGKLCSKLSQSEVDILCLLLEVDSKIMFAIVLIPQSSIYYVNR